MIRAFQALHPNIQVRLTTSFLGKIIGSAVFPLMAIYFARHYTLAVVALLLGTQYVVQFLTSLYGGFLADTVGRKRLMLTGEVVKLLAFLGMLLANLGAPHPLGTFAALLVLSVATGLAGPASDAMLIDVSTQDNRAFMYSVNYWANNLGTMLGLPLGAWLFRDHFTSLIGGLLGATLVILWITAARVQETLTGSRSRPEPGLRPLTRSYRTVARDRSFLLFTLSGVALMTIEFTRLGYLGVHLDQHWQDLTLSLPVIGDQLIDGARALSVFGVLNTALVVLLTGVATVLLKRRDARTSLHTGTLLFGVGYAALMLSTTLPALVLAGVVLTIGELMHIPSRQVILAQTVPVERRGAYMAVNAMIFQAGKWLSALGLALGPIVGNVGMAALLLGCALLAVTLSVVSARPALTLFPAHD
ncbi:MDR family MFS transporter [Deinococcus pimensis]|uniref:MDR family MFS transporter n=1 Tax=Deinococcus pimensis TaxID=309888 RepID=UPI000487E9DB|nr:MFS transporter [Deinococcus pimensis]